MAKKPDRVPVSVRGIIQRINRNLAPQKQKLKACRSDRWRDDLGDYYVIDVEINGVLHKHVDLEALGRELGVLAEWETVAAE